MNDAVQSVILCSGLRKQFRDGGSTIDVLSGIDFELPPGTTVSILGASGSGKSTLLQVLAGLDQPTAGKVSVCGKDMFRMGQRARGRHRNRHLGFVYQFHHLLAEFSALENVAMPLLLRGEKAAVAREQALALLAQVGLANRAEHRPGMLSGGERQRAAIARALVTSPDCVLADEPTGNLDSRTADHVFERMLELNAQRQTSFVLVTHDERLAARTHQRYRLVDTRLVREV